MAFRRSGWRTVATAATAVVAAVPVAVVAGGGPAQAADTFQCSGNGAVFAVQTTGNILRYPLTAPGTTSAATGASVDVGGGWQAFPRVLGGPNGRVYGINSTGQLHRYRYNGSGWDVVDNKQGWQIGTGFTPYTTAAYRDKITVDEIGDFYLVDSDGRLRWYRFNETTKTWVVNGRTIDTGWSRYNLIVAAGPGVLYGRTPAGELHRSRFEPTSQRWLVQHQHVGTGWEVFTKGLFSVGGDALYGVRSTGVLSHYRYREDNNSWPVLNRQVGSRGWEDFTNLAATTNTCKLTDRRTPVRPSTPLQTHSPTVAVQRPPKDTALGAIEYVYTDNIGTVRHGYQPDPHNFNSLQWSTVNTPAAFTGRPSLSLNPKGDVRLLAQSTTSDAWSFTRVEAPSTSWRSGVDIGGAMKSRPVAVQLSDGTSAAFALDADGALWARQYAGTVGDLDLLPWRKMGGSGLTGELTVVAGIDLKASIFALDADGTPVTANYLNGTVSSWTELGGTGFTATPAAVTLPGQVRRVFARAADGQIMTQAQSSAGVWPGVWAPVGTFVSAGAPAAVLDPPTGRLTVVARGTDNEIYKVFETATGSGAWGEWKLINDDQLSDPSVTDPTITPFANASGQSYLVVFRNINDATRVYERKNGPTAAGTARRKAASLDQTFTAHQLPAPAKK